jgi:hypothetical protein
MWTLWDAIRATLSVVNREGEPHPLLTGRETDAELRRLAVQLAQRCPAGEFNRHCPFYTLNGLHHETAKNIVEQMSRESLVDMFEDERQCRKHHRAGCFQTQAKPPAAKPA